MSAQTWTWGVLWAICRRACTASAALKTCLAAIQQHPVWDLSVLPVGKHGMPRIQNWSCDTTMRALWDWPGALLQLQSS